MGYKLKTSTKKQLETNNSIKVRKNISIKKVSNIFLLCLFIPIFIVAALCSGSILYSKINFGVPMVLNYSVITISSGSMVDAGFNVGEKFVIKKETDYSVGDNIAFFDYVDPNCSSPLFVSITNKPVEKARTQRIVFHEIIEIFKDSNGKKWYRTKGSNNAYADYNIIYENYVIGKNVVLNETLLNIINEVCSIKGAIIFIVIPCLIIIAKDCYTLSELIIQLQSIIRKEKREKTEQKK